MSSVFNINPWEKILDWRAQTFFLWTIFITHLYWVVHTLISSNIFCYFSTIKLNQRSYFLNKLKCGSRDSESWKEDEQSSCFSDLLLVVLSPLLPCVFHELKSLAMIPACYTWKLSLCTWRTLPCPSSWSQIWSFQCRLFHTTSQN